MTLEECYNAFGGNYHDVLARLLKKERIEKFLKAFPEQDFIAPLENALNKKDYKTAFIQAHSLKGVCATLGISRLLKSSSELTEAIRDGIVKQDPLPLFEKVKNDYKKTIEAISLLS